MKKKFALAISILFLIACMPACNPPSAATIVEDAWETKAPMNQARADCGVVTVGDKIYAIGGSLSGNWRVNAVGTNEEYDPQTNTWTTRANMPTARAKFAIATYGNLIYCIGGVTGTRTYAEPALNGLIVTGEVGTKAIEVYNTITGIWEQKKNATYPIGHSQTHVINDSIYIIQTTLIYVYNITDETWTQKPRAPIENYEGLIATGIDNKIVVASLFEKWDRETHLYIYDTTTDNWTKSSKGYPFYSFSGIAATTGTKAPKMIYVFGTYYPEGTPKLVTQAYDLEKDTWIEAAPMPSERYGFGSAVINDIIHTIGSGDLSKINEQYTPIGYSTPPTITFTDTQTKTYNQSSISLNFTLDKLVNWTGYSLDNQDNVTFTGNLDLTNLSNGAHNLTVYANDTYGSMGASEIVYFDVNAPIPFPFEVAITIIAVGIVSAAIVLYYKKARKR